MIPRKENKILVGAPITGTKGSSALSVQINLASKDSTPWKDKGLRETELVGGGRTFFLGGHLVVLF
jgi:hypothetical protein